VSDIPHGPGLGVRWLVAVPLMLISTVLPVFGQLTSSAVSFDLVSDGPGPTFWERFWDDADNYLSVLVLHGIVTLVFLVRRTMFAVWPQVCLWLAVGALAPVLFVGDADDLLLSLAVGAGVVLLNFALGRLTLWVLSRPVARDVALSKLEIRTRCRVPPRGSG
jgi:hypothetical protein